MFILRRMTSESNQVNTCLGTIYNLVEREKNPQEFYRTYAVYIGEDPDNVSEELKKSLENDVYGFISYDLGKEIMPLFRPSHYYIMLSDGKTFSNISFRGVQKL